MLDSNSKSQKVCVRAHAPSGYCQPQTDECKLWATLTDSDTYVWIDLWTWLNCAVGHLNHQTGSITRSVLRPPQRKGSQGDWRSIKSCNRRSRRLQEQCGIHGIWLESCLLLCECCSCTSGQGTKQSQPGTLRVSIASKPQRLTALGWPPWPSVMKRQFRTASSSR